MQAGLTLPRVCLSLSMAITKTVLTFFLIYFSLHLVAQMPGTYFHQISTSEGLSERNNAWVFQDSRGFVWISSIDGLNKFDGHQMKVYRSNFSNPDALHGQNIQSSMFEAPNGDLWFSTYEAINVYQVKTDCFSHVQLTNPVNGEKLIDNYHVFHLDKSGQLWIAMKMKGETHIFTYHIKTGKTQFWGTTQGNRALALEENGAVKSVLSWIYNSDIKSLQMLDCSQRESKQIQFVQITQLKEAKIRQIIADTAGMLWMTTSKGLVHFGQDGNEVQFFTPPISYQAFVTKGEPRKP
jgi:ligand-binding sensor domain-containing protein